MTEPSTYSGEFHCIVGKQFKGDAVVTLTPDSITFQATKKSSHFHYSLPDLFGCTINVSRKTTASATTTNGVVENPVFLVLQLFPKLDFKACCVKKARIRSKLRILIRIQSLQSTQQDNLLIAEKWRNRVNAAVAEALMLSCDEEGDGDSFHLTHMSAGVRKILAIVNPKSGKGQGLQIIRNVVAPILQDNGIILEVFQTRCKGHAREKAKGLELQKYSGIVTVGGDGILNEFVNGLKSRLDGNLWRNYPLGAIPTGTGNGLARSLAHYSGESETYLESPALLAALGVTRGTTVPINLAEVTVSDSGQTHVHYCFLSVGFGMISDLDIESEPLRWMGEARNVIWAWYKLGQMKKSRLTLQYRTVDGQMTKVETDFLLIHASFVPFIGTDAFFAPSSKASDGLIHLVYIDGNAGRADVLSFFLGLSNGTHAKPSNNGVKYVQTTEFSVDAGDRKVPGFPTIDGEHVEGNKFLVKILPEKLNMFSLS